VLIELPPVVLGETARRIGRLDEAPCVHQGKRCGGFGVRKPVGVGIPSVVAQTLFRPGFRPGAEDWCGSDQSSLLAPCVVLAPRLGFDR